MNILGIKRAVLTLFCAASFGSAALASDQPVRVASHLSVPEAVERLTSAVKQAGAQVFMVVDYQEGVASVGETIRPTTLVVFGSPKIGAAVFRETQTIGLYLPLKVLAYEDEAGDVWLIYDDPAEAAVDHGVPVDHPAIASMKGALSKLTSAAAGS